MNNEQRTIKNRGFTLPELLTGLTIFSLVIGAASGIFVSTIMAQRKSLAYQELLDQTGYLIEYMSRSLRMAKKDLSGDCVGVKTNYQNPSGDSSVRFLDYKNQCHEFLEEGDQLKERKSSNASSTNLGSPIPLTSPKLKINFAKFQLSGQGQNDDLQPRVSVFLEIKGAGVKPEQQPEIKIQTTISQRNLDIEQ